MVCRGRAHLFEERPPLFESGNQTTCTIYLKATYVAESVDLFAPIRTVDVDHPVRTKSRYHSAFPTRLFYSPVMFERVARGISRRQDFDVEALEQTPRSKLRPGELLGNVIINTLSRFTGEFLIDAKYRIELLSQPCACRCAAKKMKVLRKDL